MVAVTSYFVVLLRTYFSMANEDSHLAFVGPSTGSTMAVCLQ